MALMEVWRYELIADDGDPPGNIEIRMKQGAKILHIGRKGSTVCAWAEVNPAALDEPRRFVVYGTGHPITEIKRTHLHTYSAAGGALIWHLYEID